MKLKNILTLVFIVLVNLIYAQPNNPLYDNQRIHFGFSIIGNQGKMKYTIDKNLYGIDTLKNIKSINFPGIGLGGICNFRLGKFFDLRTMAVVQFTQRNLEYQYSSGAKKIAKIESTYLEVPLLLKFKSERHKNTRIYVIGGFNYRFDFASDIKTDRSSSKPIVALKPNTYNYDIGFGFDFYYPYFKFSPELKISNTIGNTLVKDDFLFTKSISGLYPKLIQISLHFE